ncbi:MAG: SLBB domain-containing protein [Treponema sp.]|jgi:electron transport complex protein RnfC|nr:SLBB domain-containing protein [Treponema sp.]
MRIYSFPHGGISYNDPTAPSKKSVVNAYLPSLSVIPIGKRIFPTISIGDMVREGMLIARATEAGTVNVHATVPGRVIKKASWKNRDGFENDALVIRMEGSFEKLGKREEVFPWAGLNCYDLQRIISEFGIVEMEYSGRPLSEMISAGRKENDKLTLVIRCVFDDPWHVADYALCQQRIKAVVEGAAIVAKASSKVTQIIFAVSHREKEIGEMFIKNSQTLEYPAALVLTGSRYPQRNNRELELALRTYEKKEELSLGAFLILGPAVLAAVYDAVKFKKPILERYVAVGGSAVRYPQVMKARIGTRIGELIEQCGGLTGKPERIVLGSPLSGREVSYLDEPVGSTCYAIVAMAKSQAKIYQRQNCINCGECRTVCPIGLDPQNIYKRIRTLGIEKTGDTGCHGCGCCKIVCPSSLPLSEVIFERNTEAAGA